MEEIDLKELLEMFWTKKLEMFLLVLIFIVIGITYTMGFVTPKYTSSTTLVLASGDSKDTEKLDTITTSDITLNSKLVSTYSELIKSKNVLRKVKENLGINIKEEEIKNNINVTSVKDTELIEIAVTRENSKEAADIANEIAKVFTEKVKEIYNINNVYVVDKAEESFVPSNINHTKDVVLFTFIGIVVAFMYVLIVNMLDTTVKTQEQIEKMFKVHVLASIPLNIQAKGGKK